MSSTITITLLMFAAISFAGAGVACAVGRARELADFTPDLAMRTVASLLMIFGATCAYLSTGFTTILAFGAVIAWVSYVISAQRVGVFEIVKWRPYEDTVEERRPIA